MKGVSSQPILGAPFHYPNVKNMACQWLAELVLTIGYALILVGSLTLVRNVFPLSTAIAFMSVGSFFVIVAFFKWMNVNEEIDLTTKSKEIELASHSPVTGSGIRKEKKITFSKRFATIELQTPGKVYITHGSSNSLTLFCDDNILPLLEQRVDKGKLIISTNGPFKTKTPLIYHLCVPAPETLIAKGSGFTQITDLTRDNFICKVLGSGKVKVMGGQLRSQTIIVKGSGAYEAASLQSHDATVLISGSGNATVNTQSLDVRITGSGHCYYQGSPQVDQTILGSGAVQAL